MEQVKEIERNSLYREMWLTNKMVCEPSIETIEAYTNGTKNIDIIKGNRSRP